jgi:hypothetical protein
MTYIHRKLPERDSHAPAQSTPLVIAVYEGVSLLDLTGPWRASFGRQQDDPRQSLAEARRRAAASSAASFPAASV